MLNHLVDVSIRVLALAAVAGLILAISGRRRTAALQHAIWAAVVCGMLTLYVAGGALPKLALQVIPAADFNPTLEAPAEITLAPQPSMLAPPHGSPSIPPARTFHWTEAALLAYFAVALLLLARLLTGLTLIRRLMTQSTPCDSFFESDLVAVPVTVGWLRPRIILPADWRNWPTHKFNAVLAHEGAHVRRRDGLVTLLAGINRCLFWFHPLAWFLERKLALLAEEACDEACIAELGDADAYARLLVEMASLMDGSQKRLNYHALTMASPTHLRRRIDSLLADGRTFSGGLSRAAIAVIAVCVIPLVLIAGGVNISKQPPALHLDLPRWSTPQPAAGALTAQKPVLIAQAAVPEPPQTASAPAPKFDTATIKRCEEGDGAGRGGRGGEGGRGFVVEPGSFFVHCMSLQGMIDFAVHEDNALPPRLINDGPLPEFPGRIRGGPAWANSELFTIDARTADAAANVPRDRDNPRWTAAMHLMGGPMLLSLLQDRFQLKLDKRVEQIPMYALSLAPGGLKLKSVTDDDCVQIGRGVFPYPGGFKYGRDPKPPCNWIGWGINGPNRTFEGGAVTMSRFTDIGDLFLDRHVLDQTGVSGRFNIHLEYLPDEHATPKVPLLAGDQVDPNSSIPKAPTIFRAIEEQLGLRLEATQGPRGYVMIDSAERPSLN